MSQKFYFINIIWQHDNQISFWERFPSAYSQRIKFCNYFSFVF